MSESQEKISSSKGNRSFEKFNVSGSKSSTISRTFHSMQKRIWMIGLLSIGTLAMVAHDRFYSYLNGKPFPVTIDTVSAFVKSDYTSVGSAISIIAKATWSSAIGIAFVQLFWMRLRRRPHTVGEIDSAMGCKQSPFGWGSILSWRYMFWLAMIPALAIGKNQIIIIASGAVNVDFAPFPGDCKMKTVNLSNSDIAVLTNANGPPFGYFSPVAQTRGFVAQIIMAGVYFPPVIENANNSLSSVSYNVTFNAPAMNCTDISSSFDFTEFLPLPESNTDPIIVWNTGYSIGQNFTLVVATRELAVDPSDDTVVSPGSDQEAVVCTMYNATYLVNVQSTIFGDISSTVLDYNLQSLISNETTDELEETQMEAIVDSFAKLLNGTASFDPNIFDFTPESPIIVYSPLGETNQDNPWSWTDRMVNALPDLMSFVSLSLLSGKLTESSGRTLSHVRTHCDYTTLAFIYNRSRLLWSYGASLIVTAFCVAFGFWAVHSNGVEESMDFSRIMRAVVNENMLSARKELDSEHTVLEVDRDAGAILQVQSRTAPEFSPLLKHP